MLRGQHIFGFRRIFGEANTPSGSNFAVFGLFWQFWTESCRRIAAY
jgi:hypothetical protein